MSPLEIARKQDGGDQGECLSTPVPAATGPQTAVNPPAATSPAPAAPKNTAPSGKKLSPLELARQQGAFKPED
jgi:hypothetical protein